MTSSNTAENTRPKDPMLFVHMADLHLAPRTSTITKTDPISGRRIRDLDMTHIFEKAVDDILAQTPAPVAAVISGDLFDTYQGSQDAIIDAARQIKRLRDAGIEVVAIAGNHDTPSQVKKTPAFCLLEHEFTHIAEDDGVTMAYDEIKHVGVGDIEFVLLPHSVVLSANFTKDDLEPQMGFAKSVLIVHGVAAGDPSLVQRDEMKEIPIAKWVLDMDWDYIAFGHYHKPGWIPGYKHKAAYCGSLENTVISGPDVAMKRGPVYVHMNYAPKNRLDMHFLDIRKIVNLPDLDLKEDDCGADELDQIIEDTLLDADIEDAIVLHTVKNVPRAVIKSMTRRTFNAVRPDALFIKTRIEPAQEARDDGYGAVMGDDGEEDGDGGLREFKPLEHEVEDAVDYLVKTNDIRESKRDEVLEAIRSVM